VSPSRSSGASRAADQEASLGRVLDFMRLMWAVNHGLTRMSKRMARTLGVTGPQRLVVRIVGQRPGISAGALAEVLHVHPSTLTGILQRLTARGAIERTRDPADTRRALFRLTRKGLEIDALRSGTVESRIRAALVSLDEEDVAAAARVLGRFAHALSQGPRSRPQPLSLAQDQRRRPQR
jgi:DNA-binding MarR family transcriptional regulator